MSTRSWRTARRFSEEFGVSCRDRGYRSNGGQLSNVGRAAAAASVQFGAGSRWTCTSAAPMCEFLSSRNTRISSAVVGGRSRSRSRARRSVVVDSVKQILQSIGEDPEDEAEIHRAPILHLERAHLLWPDSLNDPEVTVSRRAPHPFRYLRSLGTSPGWGLTDTRLRRPPPRFLVVGLLGMTMKMPSLGSQTGQIATNRAQLLGLCLPRNRRCGADR